MALLLRREEDCQSKLLGDAAAPDNAPWDCQPKEEALPRKEEDCQQQDNLLVAEAPALGGCCSWHYGWVMALACALLHAASAPGHSFTMAPFVDGWMADLSISRPTISLFWTLGVLLAGVVTPLAGALIDRVGSRCVLLVCLPFSVAINIELGRLSTSAELCFGVCLSRLVHADILPLLVDTTLSKWFVRRRGRTSALIGVTTGWLLLFPNIEMRLMELAGGRAGAHLSIAAWTAFIAVVLAAVWRDSPESMNLLPDCMPKVQQPQPVFDCLDDGKDERKAPLVPTGSKLCGSDATEGTDNNADESFTMNTTKNTRNSDAPWEGKGEQAAVIRCADDKDGAEDKEVSFTRQEATHTVIFWGIVFTQFSNCLLWVGCHFHIVDLLAMRGLGGDGVQVFYMGVAATRLLVQVFMGLCVVERMQRRSYLLYMVQAVPAAIVIVLLLGWVGPDQWEPWMAGATGVLFGIWGGMFSTIDGIILAQLFGRAHIGAITGLNRGFVAPAQAFGPALLGAVRDRTGSYSWALKGMLASTLFAALLTSLTPLPEPRLPEARGRVEPVGVHGPSSAGPAAAHGVLPERPSCS